MGFAEVADLSGGGSTHVVFSDLEGRSPDWERMILLYEAPFTSFMYYGPDTADATITSACDPADCALGYDITAGDTDGDGAADLLLTARGTYENDPGFVFLFTHLPSGTVVAEDEADTVIEGPSAGDPGMFAGDEDLHGDFNGDGCADAVVQGGEEEPVLVFDGPLPTGTILPEDRDEALTSATAIWVYTLEPSTGDLDGDGYDDLALADDGRVRVWRGPLDAEFTVGTADISVGRSTDDVCFGASITTEVDLDGDGRDDLIAGDPCYSSREWMGGVYVFYGGLSGSATTAAADAVIRGTQHAGPDIYTGYGAGQFIRPVGDVNQDGFEDVFFRGRDADLPYPDLDDYLNFVVFGGPR